MQTPPAPKPEPAPEPKTPAAPVKSDSAPQTVDPGVAVDDQGKPIPFAISAEEALKALSEALDKSGGSPIDGGVSITTGKP